MTKSDSFRDWGSQLRAKILTKPILLTQAQRRGFFLVWRKRNSVQANCMHIREISFYDIYHLQGHRQPQVIVCWLTNLALPERLHVFGHVEDGRNEDCHLSTTWLCNSSSGERGTGT